jgi:hypothetical protein
MHMLGRVNHADSYDFGNTRHRAMGDPEASQRLDRIQRMSATPTPAAITAEGRGPSRMASLAAESRTTVRQQVTQDSDYAVSVKVIKKDRFQLNKAT